jgi:hypothetical protein
MQNAMENNPKFRILQGVIIFVLFRLAGFAKNASPHFPKTPTDDNPMPAPKKSHASKRSVLGAFGSASACDPELNAISNSDPGNPAIPATRSIPGGLGYPTHSANRGEDPSQPSQTASPAEYAQLINQPGPFADLAKRQLA